MFNYKLKEITSNQLVFKRHWFTNQNLLIEKKDVKEICFIYFRGKLSFYLVFLKSKIRKTKAIESSYNENHISYKIPNSIEESVIRKFAIDNKILLTKEEGWHGGGTSIIYKP